MDEKEIWKTCQQEGCEIPAHVSYFWPGKDKAYACLICAQGLMNVAAAIGLHLPFERYQGENLPGRG